MPNIRLIVEYNGACFHGWQKQPGLRTIEEELHRVLKMVLREEIRAVYASGRTDAGVHAKGQVVNFWTTQSPDLNVLKHSVSSILKGELAVLACDIVSDDFHARESATSKQYTYTILSRDAPAVLDRGRVWHVSGELDVEKMALEAKVLVGEHDFTSFRGAGCHASSVVKEIFESEITKDGYYVRYRVAGSGFLKQMVRNIAGTLVGIGRGRLAPSSIEEILAARDRTKAGVTAPAYGLCLDWVRY